MLSYPTAKNVINHQGYHWNHEFLNNSTIGSASLVKSVEKMGREILSWINEFYRILGLFFECRGDIEFAVSCFILISNRVCNLGLSPIKHS